MALDLACGTGDIAFLLADRYPQGEVTGLDLTAEMLTRARGRARRRKTRRSDTRREKTRRDGGPGAHLRFVQGDMNALPWRDSSVDIVTGGYALRNAPDLENTLGEIFRVLRPGGIAAFLEFSFVPLRGLRGAQLAILRFWGQLWGILLHGDPEVYAYIARSLERYPDRDTLEQILSRRGYRVLHGRTLMLGFARITRVAKPVS